MDRISDFRQVYSQVVVARAGCDDAAIRAAFARVPRHEFLPPGPWELSETPGKTPSDDPALVYHDVAIGLVPEQGIPTGQPSLHARCIAACAPKPGDCVVQIGVGAGYYTAILAELVGPTGRVLGFEIDRALALQASGNLAAWPWARIEHASGVDAAFEAADVIYVNAGVEKPPRSWFERLRPQGRLVLPLTPDPSPAELHAPGRVEYQRSAPTMSPPGGGVFLVREQGSAEAFSVEFLCRVRLVPCIDARDEATRPQLLQAFRTESCAEVRSLRLWPQKPDHSAWFVGTGFWLSTASVRPSVRVEPWR
jgi:protein-L-isoaspartate(D-aspartate) O-methyltransferase